MRARDFEFLYQLEESFWWFVAMRRITDAILGPQLHGARRRILDAGCGAGYNLVHYTNAGHDVFGFDVAPETLPWIRKRGITTFAEASVAEIPYASESFDLAISMDALSHIPVESLEKSLKELHRVLKPGGFLFVRVAAFEWLRSSHDEEMKTLHRFTRGEFRDAMVRSGFRIERTTYANTFLFPVAVIHRILKQLGLGGGTDAKPMAPALAWTDPILRTILGSEAAFARVNCPLPIGLSVICYGRKGVGTKLNPGT